MAGPCRRDCDISVSPLSVETKAMLRRVTMDTHSSASVARMVTMDASTLVLPELQLHKAESEVGGQMWDPYTQSLGL